MSNGARFGLYTAGAIVVLMLLRDGSLPRLINDAAKGAQDLTGGLRPITRVA